MALLKKKVADLPSDAIVLTSGEALEYEWKIINGWKETKDVWALKFGPGIMGAMSAASGIFINHFYRRKLKLGRYGQLSSYLPIVVLPAITSAVFHKLFVQRAIILHPEECPVCIEVRSISYQSALGIVYPTVIAPFAAFMFATRHFTYRVPSIIAEPKAVFQLWRKISNPIFTPLAFGLAAHVCVAAFITFMEMENFYKLQDKLQALEQRLEHGA